MTIFQKELSHLSKTNIRDIKQIFSAVRGTGMANMVVLFGSCIVPGDKHIFQESRGGDHDFSIFVITRDERDRIDLKDRLSRIFADFPQHIEVIVESLGCVNMHMRNNDSLYYRIIHYGIELYKDSYLKLDEPGKVSDSDMIRIAEKEFHILMGLAKSNFNHFLYAKEIFISKQEHTEAQKAAFELHQCAEHCYSAVELLYTRHKTYERRLNILRINAARHAPGIDKAFPMDTLDNYKLFHHLDKAYIGGRYYDEDIYKVTLDQLEYWEGETQKLLKAAETAFKRRVDEIKNLTAAFL